MTFTINGTFADPDATASSETKGNLIPFISVFGLVHTSKAGDYTITYAFEDLSFSTSIHLLRKVTFRTDPIASRITSAGLDTHTQKLKAQNATRTKTGYPTPSSTPPAATKQSRPTVPPSQPFKFPAIPLTCPTPASRPWLTWTSLTPRKSPTTLQPGTHHESPRHFTLTRVASRLQTPNGYNLQ